MRSIKVTSVKELVEKAGGPKATGDLLGTSPQNVVNWRAAGKIPARFHIVHRQRLAARGLRVDDSCWGFVEAAE